MNHTWRDILKATLLERGKYDNSHIFYYLSVGIEEFETSNFGLNLKVAYSSLYQIFLFCNILNEHLTLEEIDCYIATPYHNKVDTLEIEETVLLRYNKPFINFMPYITINTLTFHSLEASYYQHYDFIKYGSLRRFINIPQLGIQDMICFISKEQELFKDDYNALKEVKVYEPLIPNSSIKLKAINLLLSSTEEELHELSDSTIIKYEHENFEALYSSEILKLLLGIRTMYEKQVSPLLLSQLRLLTLKDVLFNKYFLKHNKYSIDFTSVSTIKTSNLLTLLALAVKEYSEDQIVEFIATRIYTNTSKTFFDLLSESFALHSINHSITLWKPDNLIKQLVDRINSTNTAAIIFNNICVYGEENSHKPLDFSLRNYELVSFPISNPYITARDLLKLIKPMNNSL